MENIKVPTASLQRKMLKNVLFQLPLRPEPLNQYNAIMLKHRKYARLLLVLGSAVAIYGAFFMETTHRLNELFGLFVIWFGIFDVITRTYMLEDSRLLFTSLKSSSALLAGSAVFGIATGFTLGSDQILVLFTGILLYGIGGFLSTWMLDRYIFPQRTLSPA